MACGGACEAAARGHPWLMPSGFRSAAEIYDAAAPLFVYNSLTRSKTRFVPQDPSRVLWYQCGPTVYDSAHMGHARTYATLDTLRRIMRDVLGYNMIVVQNVTDIDDKIIIRSRERGIPFRELASRYEQEFNEDMRSLGVELPDVITRVSEYVPEVLEFISTLVERGLAYASNGSVYFDVAAYRASPGHAYGKLLPEQLENLDLVAEGEGALADATAEKRGPADFALWKRTPEPEAEQAPDPSWDSPWGPGRPGWHIECSVMAYFATRGLSPSGSLDVHAGGIDLRFPHHENEVAQSEAFLGSDQWVNYWLHTGHLNIKGFKMSKSLKNFITIRQALVEHTARQLRMLFLMHKYNATMDYGDGTMSHAIQMERTFAEFFLNVRATMRERPLSGPQKVGPREEALLAASERAKAAVRAALLDDFDTPTALAALRELVRQTNVFMDEPGASNVLRTTAEYVRTTLSTLGLQFDAAGGGGGEAGPAGAGASAESREEAMGPVLDVLSRFRRDVRLAARHGDAAAVLAACDAVRDEVLPGIGVRLEDLGSGDGVTSRWKLEDPEVLAQERRQKEDEAKLRAEQKARQAQAQADRAAREAVPAEDMFRSETGDDGRPKYGSFDERGIPMTDAAGEPLSNKQRKRLAKQWEARKNKQQGAGDGGA